MRIVALADLHRSENAAIAASDRISAESADAAFVVGDISHGDLHEALRLLDILGKSRLPIYFVPGNMDSPELSRWTGKRLRNLHGRCESYSEYTLAGLGGAIHTPFKTPLEFTEEEVGGILDQAVQGCGAGRLVLITHSPPKNTRLDLTRSGIHAGSRSVRNFIENRGPTLVVCGHIHEAQGIDQIAKTILVNPGPAYLGGYARIELDEEVQVTLAKFSTT